MRWIMLALLLAGCASSDSDRDGAAGEPSDIAASDHICAPPQVMCNGKCLWSCNGTCVNLRVDETNCGECGKACAEGFICSNSECVCPGSATACDGFCTNTDTDHDNCGRCGNVCSEEQECAGGKCSGEVCNPPLKLCYGVCVDVSGDNNNCGDCDAKCDTAKGYACVKGSCEQI